MKTRFLARRLAFVLNVFLILALIPSYTTPAKATASASPSLLPGDPLEESRLGMNTGIGAADWDPAEMFADVMKTFRQVTRPDGSAVSLDAQGWPLADARFLVWHGLVRPPEIYQLRFVGSAASITAVGATISNVQYNSGTNTTTANVNLTGAEMLSLTFTGTNGGVRNVQLMMPGHTFDEIWNHAFLAAIAPMKVIRLMDFTATNWSQDVNWSDRTLPSAATQQQTGPGYGWQGKGIAWEYAIDLLNTANKDGWINIPAEANDAYVASLIDLFKNGGNGFAPLEQDRKLYIEYSNEVWNGGFDQAQYNYQQAVAEVNAGNSPLNFDGDPNDWYWAWRRVAKRIVEISNQFRAAFGDSQMMTRFRPVLAWQMYNGQATAENQLDFIQKYYGTSLWGYPNPHPVNYYIWCGGGAAYHDDIPLAQDTFFQQAVQMDSKYAAAYGIYYCSYEGGMTFDGESDMDWYEPWVTQYSVDHHQYFEEHGGNLLMYFSLAGLWGDKWGYLETVRDLDTPKYNALVQLSQQSGPWANTFGGALPMQVDGNAFSLSRPSWRQPGAGATVVYPLEWRAYHFDANTPGLYNVWIEYRSSNPIDMRIFGAGEPIATITTNTGGVNVVSPTYSFYAPAGLKSIRIENWGANTFGLFTIHVELAQDMSDPSVVSIQRSNPSPSGAATVNFTVTFSEPVTGVDIPDFSLVASGVSGATLSGLSGSGSVYTVSASTGSGDGTLRLDLIDDDSIIDLDSNPLGGPGAGNGNFTGEAYSIVRIAPALLSPVNGANLSSLRPFFDWTDFTGATGYQLQASKNSTFPSMGLAINVTVSGASNSQFTAIKDLPANTLMYWRVRAKFGASAGTWSETGTFTTANPPSVPVLNAPANGALVASLSPLFDWKDSSVPSGVTFDHYQIQIATDVSFNNLVHDNALNGVTNSQDNSAVLSPATTYYWRVRSFAADGDTSAWSLTRSVKMKYVPPTLLSPIDLSTVLSLRPSFTWSAVTGASGYTIQLSKSLSFGMGTINANVLSPTYAPGTNLAAHTTYYWRVRVNGTYGPSDWSVTFSFTTP